MLAKEEKESVKVVGEENPPPQRFQRKVRGGGGSDCGRRLSGRRPEPPSCCKSDVAIVLGQVSWHGTAHPSPHKSQPSCPHMRSMDPLARPWGRGGGGGVVSTHTHKSKKMTQATNAVIARGSMFWVHCVFFLLLSPRKLFERARGPRR